MNAEIVRALDAQPSGQRHQRLLVDVLEALHREAEGSPEKASAR